MMRVLLIVLIIFLPSKVFGKDISGSVWVFEEGDNDKTVVLFEIDNTITYMNLVSASGVEGQVYGDEDDTYLVSEDLVVISFNDGYMICSLTINARQDSMSGTCINKAGLVQQIYGRQIE